MADLTTQLTATVDELRHLLSRCATSELAGMLYVSRMRPVGQPRPTQADEPRLHSPARQQAFLLGLLLATNEPVTPQKLDRAGWEHCLRLLNKAFGLYASLFMPDKPGEQSEEWWRAREVAGPVFMQYFNNGLIASVEQIRARVQAYCVPFDEDLERSMGLSGSDALAIMDFIVDDLQRGLNVLTASRPQLQAEQQRFLTSGDSRRRHDPDYPAFLRTHYPTLHAYFQQVTRPGQVARASIQAAFPAQAAAFWERYAIQRGEGPPLHYPTESSIFNFKPLLLLNDDDVSCPSTNSLFEAVLRSCEAALAASSVRERFFRHRDKVLEQEGEKQFRRLAGAGAQVVSSVFESPKAHHEHDLLLLVGSTVLVVEAKASPPIEPSRSPERAYERLQQSFRKDTGIQKGFEQAARLQRRLAAGELVPLYTRTGELVLTLDPRRYTECFCICLTRDDFGHLATNLNLLLEKAPTEPYPWAVNILDLEAIADAWEFLSWDFGKLCDYLRQRQQVQGRVAGGDELEFAGAFIRHGSLTFGLRPDIDLLSLNPHYSDFFDELYVHRRYGGPAPNKQFTKPILTGIGEGLGLEQPGSKRTEVV